MLGLTTRPRLDTPLTTRVSVHVLLDVFQLLDNHPLLGHYRVKMALDSLGYRYSPTTGWQLVALYKQAHPVPPQAPHLPTPAEQPLSPTAPQQVWFVDVRYLVQIEGQWLYSILIFDGYSRAIVGGGCYERQNLSRVMQVLRQAITHWGAPATIVRDHAGVFLALQPCLEQLGIQGAPITKGHPWQTLAEGGFSIQRRMLDAYVVGCTNRDTVYRQHAQFVHDYQFWGHWAHKRQDAPGRIYYLSPEVILGNTKGRAIDAVRLRRVFRLRQVPRTIRQYGQIRLDNFSLYVDQGLWGHPVEVLIYEDMLRLEQAEQVIVSYTCCYNIQQRRITMVDAHTRQQYDSLPVIQLALLTLEIVRVVWRMPLYRRLPWSRRMLQAQQMSLFDRFAD